MTTTPTRIKQRRCAECGSNLLIENVWQDLYGLRRRRSEYYCIDCGIGEPKFVEDTVLVEIDWNDESRDNPISKRIERLQRQIESARANISRMMEASSRRMKRDLGNE